MAGESVTTPVVDTQEASTSMTTPVVDIREVTSDVHDLKLMTRVSSLSGITYHYLSIGDQNRQMTLLISQYGETRIEPSDGIFDDELYAQDVINYWDSLDLYCRDDYERNWDDDIDWETYRAD